jgi:hypothetical protein
MKEIKRIKALSLASLSSVVKILFFHKGETMKNLAYLLILTSLLLASCSALLPQPTATPVPTDTPIPTDTPAPTSTPLPTATSTPEPTVTPTETIGPDKLVPKGTPDKEWHGIKIMPGALAGSGDDESYRFTIKASAEDIKAFYEKELGAAGWTLLGDGVAENGGGLLIFIKDTATFTVSIIQSDDLFIVMLLG